ncbi:chemotaxis protein [Helicobacter sp. 11S03491-1]|uniref:chemotaxis protein CheV n=1 Tax=Helicobacter sp. 11S03491-1 TaxID=1476196 RepID=UPI000BA62F8D|nr:chemotaxis protein [Helicobacter sp. 11S03491-1]PAF41978.1 fused signal transduction protein/response regulator [Helicobacter sp. 11S03491-1]
MAKDHLQKHQLNANEIELIDFRIFETRDNRLYEGIYGINVAKVQEIIKMPEIFEIPASPDYITGVFDLRSTLIPLVDLCKWIGISTYPSNKEKNIIIAQINHIQIGFMVDCVKRIRRISWQNIQPAHFNFSNTTSREKITGVTQVEEGKTLLILDLESIAADLNLTEENNKKQTTPSVKSKFNGIVLFLEDSTSARNLIAKNLTDMGFEIVEAMDGQDGILKLEKLYEKFQESLPHHLRLIISDVEMPKMDGFHFLSQIHNDKRFYNIPVIFNSSICDKYSAQKAKELGAKAYLVKFDTDKFYDEISKILS